MNKYKTKSKETLQIEVPYKSIYKKIKIKLFIKIVIVIYHKDK